MIRVELNGMSLVVSNDLTRFKNIHGIDTRGVFYTFNRALNPDDAARDEDLENELANLVLYCNRKYIESICKVKKGNAIKKLSEKKQILLPIG